VNLERLSRILNDLDVPFWAYSLDGSHHEGACVIASRGDGWVVFLSERGDERRPVCFDDEDEASTYLFGRICLEMVGRGELRVDHPPPLLCDESSDGVGDLGRASP
jgi:hypothetical protein